MSLVLLIILGSLIAFVIISAVIFYYTQEYILFHPTVLPLDHQYEFKGNVEFEEFRFKADKDAVIYGLHFKPKNPKALLFYFHGNSKDVQHWGFWCEAISEKYNLEVVVADYRGFGKSTGTRTIGAMLNDALAVYRFFEHIPLPHIVYGRSLGGAFASHVALVNQIDKLIL